MWFGTTPDEALVDPGFPRRFVPRAFDAILRHGAHKLLPEVFVGSAGEPKSPTVSAAPGYTGAEIDIADEHIFSPVPNELGECQKSLVETRAHLVEMKRQRDALRVAMDSIRSLASSSKIGGSP